MTETVYHIVKRICPGLIKSIEQIKYLSDKVQADSIAKGDLSGDANIDRKESVCYAHIASEVAICRKDSRKTVCIQSGLAKRSIGSNGRPLVGALKIAIGIARSDDVKRPAGADLDDRCKRKSMKEFLEAIS